MIGISSIATALGESTWSAAALADELGYPSTGLEDRTGFSTLAECREPAPEIHLAEEALGRLLENRPDVTEKVGLLVYVGQVRTEAIPHASAVLHGRYGLPSTCEVIDLALGCTGYVQALGLVRDFARARGTAHAVVVTSDPYRSILRPDDRSTSLIFSDAATATLLDDRGPFVLGEYRSVTASRDWRALRMVDRQLEMDGRVVLRIARTVVPQLLEDVAVAGGLALDDVDLILVHQGSRAVVDAIRRELGIATDRVPFEAGQYGNTVSSSLPFLLSTRLPGTAEGTSDGPGPRNVVVCGFGVGLAASAMLLKERPGDSAGSERI